MIHLLSVATSRTLFLVYKFEKYERHGKDDYNYFDCLIASDKINNTFSFPCSRKSDEAGENDVEEDQLKILQLSALRNK